MRDGGDRLCPCLLCNLWKNRVSKSIQEVFREWEWDDLTQARQARDDRARELAAQGYRCVCETLYTVVGDGVFVLTATPIEPVTDAAPEESKSPLSRRSRNEPGQISHLRENSTAPRRIRPPARRRR
jgi:hypothetical protein